MRSTTRSGHRMEFIWFIWFGLDRKHFLCLGTANMLIKVKFLRVIIHELDVVKIFPSCRIWYLLTSPMLLHSKGELASHQLIINTVIYNHIISNIKSPFLNTLFHTAAEDSDEMVKVEGFRKTKWLRRHGSTNEVGSW